MVLALMDLRLYLDLNCPKCVCVFFIEQLLRMRLSDHESLPNLLILFIAQFNGNNKKELTSSVWPKVKQ